MGEVLSQLGTCASQQHGPRVQLAAGSSSSVKWAKRADARGKATQEVSSLQRERCERFAAAQRMCRDDRANVIPAHGGIRLTAVEVPGSLLAH